MERKGSRVPRALKRCGPGLLALVLLTFVGFGLALPARADSGTRNSAFTYDATTGLLATEVIEPGTAALALTTTYTRDAFGNILTAAVSGSGITTRTTTTTYDAKGQFATGVSNPLSQSTTATYDPRFGSMTGATDPNGASSSVTYDAFGRKTAEIAPDGTRTTWTYAYCAGVAGGTASCVAGAAYKIVAEYKAADGTTQIGPTTTGYYDQFGREVSTTGQGFNGVLIQAVTQYDNKGRVTQISRPYKTGETVYWTVYSYDNLGRVIGLTEPGGATAGYAFHGLTTIETNFLAQTKTTTKNAQGLVVSVTDAANKTTSYSYDAFGNLRATTDPVGNVSTATYDTRGKKITATDPDMGAWSYSYDVLGQLKTQTDAKSQVTTLTYDLLGRATQRVEPGQTSTWTYDTAAHGIGSLATAATTNYSQSYSYDTLGRPTQTATTEFGHTATVSTGYDANTGNVSTLTYPSGFSVQYLYNAYGYLSQVKDPFTAQTYWTGNAFNADLNPTQATAGNGLVTNWTYSATRGTVGTIKAGSGNAVANFSYSFDALGNLLTRGDANSSLNETFGYDNRNRLTSYQVNSLAAKSVTYNDIGNILTKSDVGTYSYPASGAARPHAVAGITPSGSGTVNTTFTYDANGNMTAGNGRTVEWMAFDKVKKITKGAETAEFDYGPGHERIRQIAGGGTTLYFWDPAIGVPAEKELALGGGATWKEYILVGGMTVAQHGTTVDSLGAVTATQMRYFVTDHLGSIAVVTDAAGSVVERLSYDAWGQRRNPDGSDPATPITSDISRGFTGHEMLDGVGLVNMNGRIYDPLIGRFMSADPFVADASDAQSLNRYSYVNNNPLSYTDPSGYFLKKLFKSVGKLFKSIAKGIVDLITHPRQLFALAVAVALMVALPEVMPAYIAAGISGGVAGAISTGSPLGALMGAVTGAAFYGISGANIGPLGRAGLKGLVGGTTGYITGAKFQSGFLSAGFSSIAGEYANFGEKQYAANFAVQGTVGGVAAELGGGKFRNGFATGTFNYLFASVSSTISDSIGEPPNVSDEIDYDSGLNLRVQGRTLEGTITFLCKSEPDFCAQALASMGDINVSEGGYAINLELRFVSEDADADLISGSLQLGLAGSYRKTTDDIFGTTLYRSITLDIMQGGLKAPVPAHELGHLIGLEHQYNSTDNFMSYSSTRRIHPDAGDIKRLVEAYQ